MDAAESTPLFLPCAILFVLSNPSSHIAIAATIAMETTHSNSFRKSSSIDHMSVHPIETGESPH